MLKHVTRIAISFLALWTWVGLIVVKFIPAMVDRNYGPLQAFVAISGMTLGILVLTFLLASSITRAEYDKD